MDFCGSDVKTEFGFSGFDAMFDFRKYDNGQFKNIDCYVTKHPNILRAVIIGKKAWGLWLNEFTDGIVEGSFTKEEILSQFDEKGIKIPESLKLDFLNRLHHKKMNFIEKMFEEYKKSK